MEPDPEQDATAAAAQMARATDRLRDQARMLAGTVGPIPAQRPEPTGDDADDLASFRVGTYAGRPVLTVGGQIDMHTAPDFSRHLHAILSAEHRDVIVDLSRVEFMDSSGLSVLVGALKSLRSLNGTVRVVARSGQLQQLFDLTGVSRLLPLHPSLEAAVEG